MATAANRCCTWGKGAAGGAKCKSMAEGGEARAEFQLTFSPGGPMAPCGPGRPCEKPKNNKIKVIKEQVFPSKCILAVHYFSASEGWGFPQLHSFPKCRVRGNKVSGELQGLWAAKLSPGGKQGCFEEQDSLRAKGKAWISVLPPWLCRRGSVGCSTCHEM